MTNLEKYAEEIKNYKGYEFCKDFVKVKILNPLGLKCDIGGSCQNTPNQKNQK